MGLKESENREGAVPRPELENLAKYLLVPRAQVGLREVNARVEPVHTQTKIRPVVITSNPTPDLTGLRSGQRSALLTVDGDAFKVEGNRIEKAFGKGKFYTTEHRATPVGGYLLSVAQKRIEAIQGINKRLKEEGWPVPYEPEVIIHYGREFRYSPYGILEPLVKKLDGGNQHIVQEELAAPVMRIKGDTRLSEFYPLKPEHGRAAQEIAFSIGIMAGAQDRKMGARRTNDITNPKTFIRYLQNFVIFVQDDQVYVVKVGDENAFLYRQVKDPTAKHKGANELFTAIFGDEEEEENEEEEEENGSEEAEDSVRDALKGAPRKPYHHRPFREQFWKGYAEGRKNPDSRKPVTVTDLRAAYGLRV